MLQLCLTSFLYWQKNLVIMFKFQNTSISSWNFAFAFARECRAQDLFFPVILALEIWLYIRYDEILFQSFYY